MMEKKGKRNKAHLMDIDDVEKRKKMIGNTNDQ